MNNAAQDYQKLLTDVLQKQIIVLGPQITLTKARNIQGLNVSDDGHIISISGDPKDVSIKLLEQFRELSPLLVKKTMKNLLSAIISSYPTANQPQPALSAAPIEGSKSDEHHDDEKQEEGIKNLAVPAPNL